MVGMDDQQGTERARPRCAPTHLSVYRDDRAVFAPLPDLCRIVTETGPGAAISWVASSPTVAATPR